MSTFLHSAQITEVEALGISNIFRKLLLFFPPSVLVALPEEMLQQLVENLTALTCKFAQGAAHEEMVRLIQSISLGQLYFVQHRRISPPPPRNVLGHQRDFILKMFFFRTCIEKMIRLNKLF